LSNEPNRFPTFHASPLWRFIDNDNDLFPSHTLAKPGPVVTADGEEEWLVDKIINEWTHGRGHQYLVWWLGWGPEEDRWLAGQELADTEALDTWLHRPHG
jgi:hypothetical protein